ncbi:MAG: UDP-3-O-[3-hydroxymyristoyl] N-acetylglucosamine deacetylase [Planctomycetes bacterium]|nr:UDP-3-O-[3-hydroxymyristoyl] N-acetylglucosamine deacetylase [Planctomycetota bacterium]
MRQRTIKRAVEVSGAGFHLGAAVKARLKPAEAGTGVVFVRTDLPGAPRVSAVLESVTEQPRRTALRRGEAEVHTVEHLMATAYAMGITNLEVEVEGPELPALDGSALPLYEVLDEAGAIEQDADRPRYAVRRTLSVTDGEASLVVVPQASGLTLSYTLNYEGTHPTSQHFSVPVNEGSFRRELAPARTFVMESEVEACLAAGLGKGATTSNTLVVRADGSVKENALRFPDEFVRHKTLDLLGDLALANVELEAHVIAVKSGHRTNAMMVRQILEAMEDDAREEERERGIQPGVEMDVRQIQKLLPHRFPFLLVDRVVEIEGDRRAVGIKNVTYNEEFFQGHFPGQPIMPGVLQIEAMAQLAGALLLRKAENVNKLAYLMSLDDVKFRRTVVPGDQLVLEAEALSVRPDRAKVRTKASVDGRVVAEAVIRFMLVEPK